MAREIFEKQLPLFTENDASEPPIVNVASVPQRSVFRYPGGKTWFVPYLRRWLRSLPVPPVEFIEPFAGSGIVALTAAFEKLAQRVTLVEIDPQIAAVWHTLLSQDAYWLAQRIVRFEMTAKSVEAALASSPSSTRERAFQTILQNRVNRGGILAAGAGRVKTGEKGKGLASRWYPQTLARRILAIATIKERVHFIEGDGVEILEQNSARADAVFFIDPPYTAGGKRAGRRLYTYADVDHEALFRTVACLTGDFLMTYDNSENARLLAEAHAFLLKPMAMKNTHHAQMTELLISRKLDWLDYG
ncbi:MAG: DNA adenine methylase [Chloroflexi bacterium]|nr:DNA adenine methylase [Chloroflexota bacterium]